MNFRWTIWIVSSYLYYLLRLKFNCEKRIALKDSLRFRLQTHLFKNEKTIDENNMNHATQNMSGIFLNQCIFKTSYGFDRKIKGKSPVNDVWKSAPIFPLSITFEAIILVDSNAIWLNRCTSMHKPLAGNNNYRFSFISFAISM